MRCSLIIEQYEKMSLSGIGLKNKACQGFIPYRDKLSENVISPKNSKSKVKKH